MRFGDTLRIALSALYQQKGRTLLTTLGVVIGTFILALSLSIGEGVEQVVRREFQQNDQLRKIEVHAGYGTPEANIPPRELAVAGTMSDAKRERLRRAKIRSWRRHNVHHPVVPLTEERVKALAGIEHVRAVVPFILQGCRAFLGNQDHEATSCAASPASRNLQARIVAGSLFEHPDERSAVVHEYLLYLWGITGDEEVARVVGQTLRLEFHQGRQPPTLLLTLLNRRAGDLTASEERVLEKAVQQLPAALEAMDLTPAEKATLTDVLKRPWASRSRPPAEVTITEEFAIRGVIREFDEKDPSAPLGLGRISRDADVFIPVGTAEALFAQAPPYAENGFDSATVLVDREENVKEVVRAIKALGLQEFSLVEIFERVRMNIVLMTFATGFVAVVSLGVAALGITNTMVMGVLERTREIGVMKAVGARDRHIQTVFLLEGAVIGVVGGAVGLFLSWLATFPGDAVARSLVAKHAETRLTQSLFVFPLWLTLGVPLLATAVATLAAVYPARRAARVNPVEALRHE